MVFEIRQADRSDIPDLVELDDECFDTYYYRKTKFSKSDFQAYLRCRKSIFLVAVLNSHLIGYIAGMVRALQVRSIAHLDSIAVAPTMGTSLSDVGLSEGWRVFAYSSLKLAS